MNHETISNFYNFSGRTVLITGGAGVLGAEMACALVGCGANVAILNRTVATAERLLQRIEQMPAAGRGRSIAVTGDVLDRESLLQAETVIGREFGQVDTLIKAAGGNKPAATAGVDRKFFDVPEEALRLVFDLNMLGTILPSQVFGRGMAERSSGTILNVSSMAASRPMTRVVAYSAAKAATDNFTQWLAVHMAQTYSPRIRVNAIAPGFFLTDQNRFLLTDKDTGGLTDRGRSIIAHTPAGRFGNPEDLVGAVLWLLSPAAAFVTGIVVPVDGGFSAFSGV